MLLLLVVVAAYKCLGISRIKVLRQCDCMRNIVSEGFSIVVRVSKGRLGDAVSGAPFHSTLSVRPNGSFQLQR